MFDHFVGLAFKGLKVAWNRPLNNAMQWTKIEKHHFNQRIKEGDQWSFMPLVFAMNGSMAGECKVFYSRLASLQLKAVFNKFYLVHSWVLSHK